MRKNKALAVLAVLVLVGVRFLPCSVRSEGGKATRGVVQRRQGRTARHQVFAHTQQGEEARVEVVVVV